MGKKNTQSKQLCSYCDGISISFLKYVKLDKRLGKRRAGEEGGDLSVLCLVLRVLCTPPCMVPSASVVVQPWTKAYRGYFRTRYSTGLGA
jgi:hypothetical protein